jgi:hypothetical protein
MFGAATDLSDEIGAPDDLPEALKADLGQDLAHFLGDEGHQVDDLFRRAGELLAQLGVLRANADGTGI